MDPVVHFEMPAEDKKRMVEFYANVFGWKMEMLGKERCHE
jgi:predicted enzyme related to lactoylglutathione lyase